MSKLFEADLINGLNLKNRFIRSAAMGRHGDS